MPTRKIADLTPVCRHPEHNPPSMMVYEDGVYEHECPGCGDKQQFVVRKPTLCVLPREESCRERAKREGWSLDGQDLIDRALARRRPRA